MLFYQTLLALVHRRRTVSPVVPLPLAIEELPLLTVEFVLPVGPVDPFTLDPEGLPVAPMLLEELEPEDELRL